MWRCAAEPSKTRLPFEGHSTKHSPQDGGSLCLCPNPAVCSIRGGTLELVSMSYYPGAAERVVRKQILRFLR